MRVNVNFCDKSDLLTIPGVGDRTADKIVAIREKELFSLQTFADLIKKDPDEIGELVSFDDLPSSLPGLTHMSRSIALCDQRNALYSRDDRTFPVEETIPRRRVDERQVAGRNSPVLTHLPLDRDSRSGPSIQEPYEGRKYVNPPKTLTYAGDADWASFKLRYEKFCRDQKYMDLASLDYLCWVLTGKAAEYHALVIRRYPGITYREMMDQLEKRFGFRQLPQTAYLQFHQSRQKQDEKLEEWAERVCQLATYAFETAPRGGLSERDAEAMIRQFCSGTLDKEAGFHAANAYIPLLWITQLPTSLNFSFIKGQYMAHQSAVNEMLQPVLSNRTIGLNLQEETTAAVIILLDVMSLDADTSLQALTEMRTVVVSHQTRADIVDDSSLREWIETNIGVATHRSPTPEMSIAVVSRRLGIDVVSNP